MGRKRKGRIQDVYVGSSKVGTYSRAPNGSTSFRYDQKWISSKRAFPISLSMPLSDRIWSGMNADSFFDGLPPDDQAVKNKIAAREQIDSAGTFDLLSSIFLTPGGYKLTPLYDVMSAYPYSSLSAHKIKLAMAVGEQPLSHKGDSATAFLSDRSKGRAA